MDADFSPTPDQIETQSAVAWSAVFAGSFVALAIAFVVQALAAGMGWTVVSPWPGTATAAGFTPIVGGWMIATQVVAAGIGGYVAGRLRTRWLNLHSHEAHFRDTAHGLLVWAVSTVAGVGLAGFVLNNVDVSDLPVAATEVAQQFSLFMAIGLLLSGFIACVAAALGGLRRDEMHALHWKDRAVTPMGFEPPKA
jgi:MFS family permease